MQLLLSLLLWNLPKRLLCRFPEDEGAEGELLLHSSSIPR